MSLGTGEYYEKAQFWVKKPSSKKQLHLSSLAMITTKENVEVLRICKIKEDR
jgi:hypothetical protein